jgi:hypothetical protein
MQQKFRMQHTGRGAFADGIRKRVVLQKLQNTQCRRSNYSGKFKETGRRNISPVNSPEQNSYDSDWKPDSDGDDSDTDVVSKILNSAAMQMKR